MNNTKCTYRKLRNKSRDQSPFTRLSSKNVNRLIANDTKKKKDSEKLLGN